EGINYKETFASVVKPTLTRILLVLRDVKTTFLNSNLNKPIYIKPLKDIKLLRGFYLIVIRALYKLKQLLYI
ncbi:hypothetical protein K458DRAFT_285986, partial [Lentithecium fluviatile CBS 122367]